MSRWWYFGRLALNVVSERPGDVFGIGLRVSLSEPALDVFVLWWMVSLTTRAHGEWVCGVVSEQERLYAESQT